MFVGDVRAFDRHFQRVAQFRGAADMVDMAVGEPDLLDGNAGLLDGGLNLRHIAAGIDHHSLLARLVPEDGAVLLEQRHWHDGCADLVALNERGEIWIVEIKSSVEDLRADHKWEDYRAHCDRLFFAFTQDLPCEIFPKDTGLIVADAYGAHMLCEAPEHRLKAPTRKLMTVRFAMAAGLRINRLVDPQGHGEF